MAPSTNAFKSPEQGAATATWAATSPMLEGLGGVYCEDCDIAEPTVPDSPEARISGVNAHAIDPAAAARLWAYSAELTGVTPSPQSALDAALANGFDNPGQRPHIGYWTPGRNGGL